MTKIKESTVYDNFLDKKVEIEESGRLFDDLPEIQKESERLWVDMPEFIQEEKKTYKTIYLHFRNEKDFKEFVAKYKSVDTDQTISSKTKSMWYPHLSKDENSLKRWFVDDKS
jgi:hypothetical protein